MRLGAAAHANDERCALKPCIPHSITAFVFMSTCLPCLLVRRFPSQCRPSPLPPLPTASTTAATASTTAATASTTAATGVVVAATAAAALPVTTGTAAAAALPPLLRRWQLPPTATAALPLPDLTHRRCLCYRRRSTVAISVCWNVVSFCVWCDVTGPER